MKIQLSGLELDITFEAHFEELLDLTTQGFTPTQREHFRAKHRDLLDEHSYEPFQIFYTVLNFYETREELKVAVNRIRKVFSLSPIDATEAEFLKAAEERELVTKLMKQTLEQTGIS